MSPEQALRDGIDAGACPGGQLAYAQGGELRSCAAGVLDGPGSAPATEQTVYDLASLTKVLVTTPLIFRAIEAGACRLETSVADIVAGAPAVSIRALLEHSSGLPAHLRFDQRLPPGLEAGSRAACAAIVEMVAATPLEAPPLSRALYSDLGFILLGAALEIMGGPLEAQFRALGWDELWLFDRRDGPVELPARVFAPTEGELRGVVHDDNARAMGGVAGHAGLFGTANGVLAAARCMMACARGEAGPLSAASMAAMWTPSTVPGSTRTAGWDRPSPGRSSAGRHWPTGGVGHLGFTGTSLWIAPEQDLAVALVTNRVWPTRDREGIRALRPAVHEAVWEQR